MLPLAPQILGSPLQLADGRDRGELWPLLP
jgi:hypothetical protein